MVPSISENILLFSSICNTVLGHFHLHIRQRQILYIQCNHRGLNALLKGSIAAPWITTSTPEPQFYHLVFIFIYSFYFSRPNYSCILNLQTQSLSANLFLFSFFLSQFSSDNLIKFGHLTQASHLFWYSQGN